MDTESVVVAFRRHSGSAQHKPMAIPLHGGGGGGTSGGMDSATVDAKIAASEARTDTKFAKLEGKLDLLGSKLDSINDKAIDARGEARTTRRTIIGPGLSLGALILAIAAFGVNVFGAGSRVDDIARAEALQVYNQQAAIQAARSSGDVANNQAAVNSVTLSNSH